MNTAVLLAASTELNKVEPIDNSTQSILESVGQDLFEAVSSTDGEGNSFFMVAGLQSVKFGLLSLAMHIKDSRIDLMINIIDDEIRQEFKLAA